MSLAPADLIIYSAQILVVVAVAAAASAALALPARARLGYWRAIVVLCLLLPLVPAMPPWPGAPPGGSFTARFETTVTSLGAAPSLLATLASGLTIAIATGAVLRAAWLAMGLVALRRFRRQAEPALLDGALEAMRARIAPAAEWRWHSEVEQPVTFGLRRPTILLPRRLTDLSPSAQATVLCHELRHVARRDWAWLLVEEAVRSVFWFHPAVRFALREVQTSREQLVDEQVVDLTAARRDYMEALMTFANSPASCSIALSFMRRSQLRARLANLASRSRHTAAQLAWRGALLILVTAVAGVTTISALPLGARAAEEHPKVYSSKDAGVRAPTVVSRVNPEYTPAAQERKVQGTVELACVVGPDGTPQDIAITRALDVDLDRSAIDALKQWRFNPGMKDGKAVAVRVQIQMRFTLK